MKRASCIALLLVVCCSAFAQVDLVAVQRAVNAVPVLRSMMKDPDSFVLEGVYIEAGPKALPGHYEICYAFRAHNSYGGYSGMGVASQNWGECKRCSKNYKEGTLEILEGATHNWTPCQAKFSHVDITAEVKAALATPAPPTESAEDKAKHAQEYADCLKLAVDNPKVLCKQ